MDKKWFITKNGSVIDLNAFDCFMMEYTPWNRCYTAFAYVKNIQDGHRMAFFETEQEAHKYINEIYEILGKHEIK